MSSKNVSRRAVIKSSALGLLAVSIPNIIFSKNSNSVTSFFTTTESLSLNYPSIDNEIVSTVVGASHFNLEKLKKLLNKRPELSRATWDWGFGDWETAIGAASHVGRRDIVSFLMSKGARPDIFTFAMLGEYETVKSMIQAQPLIPEILGPHGITLLQHAKNGLRSDDLTLQQQNNSKKLIDYLEELGNADLKPKHKTLSVLDSEKYLGDYIYGDGKFDGFSIKRNMQENICLGRLGSYGGSLYLKPNNKFSYNYMPSVEISFTLEEDKVISLTVNEPDFTITAKKIT